jgi:5-hydroxyisourate hydrolase
MSVITTHVLDTALGRPAVGVPVRLEHVTESGCTELGRASTDHDGRVARLTTAPIGLGTYRLVFDTAAYALTADALTLHVGEQRDAAFFPEVSVTFSVRDLARDYHVPLLLSPFGYATYRGS